MPKKITTNDLAIMVQRGFEQTSTKEDLNKLKHDLDEKIDELGTKLSAQGTSWQQDFNKLESRVDLNDNDIAALNKIVLKKR